MRHFLTAALFLGALLVFGSSPEVSRAANVSRYTSAIPLAEIYNREIIVELNPQVRSASAALAETGVRSVRSLELSAASYEIVQVPAGQDYMAALRALEADPRVKSVGPNTIKRVSGIIPNDPLFLNGASGVENALQKPYVMDSQWGLLHTGATEAWDVTSGVPTVIVAVIDTGVNFAQEDMTGRWWTNASEIANNGTDDGGNGYIDDHRGWDFFDDDNDPTDDAGGNMSHGMACASIIAAEGNNGRGMMGVAGGMTRVGGVRIMPLRVGTDTNIPVSAEIAAIDYAVDNGAQIISMSFGGASGGQVEEDAIDRAWNAGVLCIAAAGNNSQGNGDLIDLPAGFDNCLSVGATSIFSVDLPVRSGTSLVSERRAPYSKIGPEMDLVAPGTHIISALNSAAGYTTVAGAQFTGTSAATPVVAGLAALLKSANPSWTASQLRERMISTAVDLGPAGFDNTYGHGRIDMAAALPAPAVVIKGDTNGDGKVDQDDIEPIRQRFGARQGESNYDARVDANDDGVIDELDVFVVGRNFGRTS